MVCSYCNQEKKVIMASLLFIKFSELNFSLLFCQLSAHYYFSSNLDEWDPSST